MLHSDALFAPRLVDQLQNLWTAFLAQTSKSLVDSLSLPHLGCFLQELGILERSVFFHGILEHSVFFHHILERSVGFHGTPEHSIFFVSPTEGVV